MHLILHILHEIQGKMNIYSFIYILCQFYLSTSFKIKPELKKNILNFGYGINYKYEGMLAHSFDRFYVVTKFILPTIGDLNFLKLNYDDTSAYVDNKNAQNTETRKYTLDFKTFCKKIEPFVVYYRRLINSYNKTTHNILEKEIRLSLPQVKRKQKHGIITTLISSFIGLAYGGISSVLYYKYNNALHKAVNAMDDKANIQHNKLMKLENSVLMYGQYNAKTLQKLINTAHDIHNTTSSHERLLASEHSPFIFQTLYAHSLGLQHYCTNSLLYLRIIQDKYVALYKELITHLHMYASTIRILAKGYLPNTLLTPVKLQEILMEVRKILQDTSPDYDLVIYQIPLYYDMPLVTFGIVKDRNLIIQFPVFVQPNTQKPLVLYQLETVPIPILDQNVKVHSYTYLQIEKSYIELNSETYSRN